MSIPDANTNDHFQKTLNNKLFKAVAQDKPAEIVAALKEGAYVNARKLTAEDHAVVTYNNEKAMYSSTPLLEATRMGHTECMKVLINHGANVNLLNVSHKSAMHVAVMKKNIPAMNLLLAVDSNLKLRDSDNRVPLDVAQQLALKTTTKQVYHSIADRLQQIMMREAAPQTYEGTEGHRPRPHTVGIDMAMREASLQELRTLWREKYNRAHAQKAEHTPAPLEVITVLKPEDFRAMLKAKKNDAQDQSQSF